MLLPLVIATDSNGDRCFGRARQMAIEAIRHYESVFKTLQRRVGVKTNYSIHADNDFHNIKIQIYEKFIVHVWKLKIDPFTCSRHCCWFIESYIVRKTILKNVDAPIVHQQQKITLNYKETEDHIDMEIAFAFCLDCHFSARELIEVSLGCFYCEATAEDGNYVHLESASGFVT